MLTRNCRSPRREYVICDQSRICPLWDMAGNAAGRGSALRQVLGTERGCRAAHGPTNHSSHSKPINIPTWRLIIAIDIISLHKQCSIVPQNPTHEPSGEVYE